MKRATAKIVESARDRRRRIASPEAHAEVTRRPEESSETVNLEAEIFGSVDAEIREGYVAEESEVEQRGTELYAQAERVRSVGQEAFAKLEVSPRATLEVVRGFVSGGWITVDEFTPSVQRGIAEMERLHDALDIRLARSQDNTESEKYRSALFNHPNFIALTERVIGEIKEIARTKYDALAEPIEEASKVALLRSEELEGYLEAYPELGEVYEAEKDTIPAARKSFRRRLCLPRIELRLKEISKSISILDAILSGETPPFLRGQYGTESLYKAPFNNLNQGNGVPLRVIQEQRNEIVASRDQKLREAQTQFLVGDIKAQRMLEHIDTLPVAEQRSVLEIQERFSARLVMNGFSDTKRSLRDGFAVHLSDADGSRDTRPNGFKGVSRETNFVLLREQFRATVLSEIQQAGKNRGIDFTNTVWSYAGFLQGKPREGIDPIILDGEPNMGTSLQWSTNLEVIAARDPEFYADMVSVLKIDGTLDSDAFKQGISREQYQALFGTRDAAGVPYLKRSTREQDLQRYNANMERVAALTEQEMAHETQGNEKTAIFTAAQGVETVERIQLAALRALAEKDALARTQVEQAPAPWKKRAEDADVRWSVAEREVGRLREENARLLEQNARTTADTNRLVRAEARKMEDLQATVQRIAAEVGLSETDPARIVAVLHTALQAEAGKNVVARKAFADINPLINSMGRMLDGKEKTNVMGMGGGLSAREAGVLLETFKMVAREVRKHVPAQDASN